MEAEDHPCPLCNSDTDWIFECPGCPGSWNGAETIMVCIHGCCCNAVEYYCTNKDCRWWYREPNDRSDRAQMGIAPAWLAEALREFEEDDEE